MAEAVFHNSETGESVWEKPQPPAPPSVEQPGVKDVPEPPAPPSVDLCEWTCEKPPPRSAAEPAHQASSALGSSSSSAPPADQASSAPVSSSSAAQPAHQAPPMQRVPGRARTGSEAHGKIRATLNAVAGSCETGYVKGPVAQPLAEILYRFITELNTQYGTNHTLPAAPSRVVQPGDDSVAQPVLYESPCPYEIWEPWVTTYYPQCMGPGVKAAFWCFRSEKDGNRSLWGVTRRAAGTPMQQRLDLILLRADSKLVVLHPGARARASAQPQVVSVVDFKR